jgi:hypothetical protein
MTERFVTQDEVLLARFNVMLDAKDYDAVETLTTSILLSVISARIRYSSETEAQCVHCWLLAVWDQVAAQVFRGSPGVLH